MKRRDLFKKLASMMAVVPVLPMMKLMTADETRKANGHSLKTEQKSDDLWQLYSAEWDRA